MTATAPMSSQAEAQHTRCSSTTLTEPRIKSDHPGPTASPQQTACARRTSCCSGPCVKMAERYCVPTSFFWRFMVVASWREKNRSTSCWYDTCSPAGFDTSRKPSYTQHFGWGLSQPISYVGALKNTGRGSETKSVNAVHDPCSGHAQEQRGKHGGEPRGRACAGGTLGVSDSMDTEIAMCPIAASVGGCSRRLGSPPSGRR